MEEKRSFPLLLLIYSIFTFLPLQAHSSDKVIGEERFETLELINPTETLRNAKAKLYIDGDLVIIHSKGVTSAKSERLNKDALKKLNYFSDERLEYDRFQNMEENQRKLEIAIKNEKVARRFKDLESLSNETKKKLEDGNLKFESGWEIDRYIYNEFRENTKNSLYKNWIEERFGKPDHSGKMSWKNLVSFNPPRYESVEYDHWTYFNILKNTDTDKYTEDVSFSFRPDDIFYSYTGPEWRLDSSRYKSLKQTYEITHEIMIKE